MSEGVASRIIGKRPYRSAQELTIEAGLSKQSLEILATSGALDCFGRNRRTELWASHDHVQASHAPLLSHLVERPRGFPDLERDEKVVWDHEVSRLSSTGHPLESLRSALRMNGFPDARTVQRTPHGRYIKYAAMVICRQRPATAKGTVFFTLEDETGFVNVIVWPKVFQEHFVVARSQSFLAVEGQIQNARGVVHLVAEKLYQPRLSAPVKLGIRNFH